MKISKNWNIEDIYQGINDPNIIKDQKKAKALAYEFIEKYRGNKVMLVDAELIHKMLKSYELIMEVVIKGYLYFSLKKFIDCQNEKIDEIYCKIEKNITWIENQLLFFKLEIMNLEEDKLKKLILTPLLLPYKGYLEGLLKEKPYVLSEKEEQIIGMKNLVCVNAWSNLYLKIQDTLEFKIGNKRYNRSEIVKLFTNPEYQIRKEAIEVFGKEYKKRLWLITYIWNKIIRDRIIDQQIRGTTQSNFLFFMEYDIDERFLNLILSVVEENIDLFHTYFKMRASSFNRQKLDGVDLSLLSANREHKYEYETALGIIEVASNHFSKKLGDCVRQFSENNWIDVETKRDKSSGNICYSIIPSVHPYIALNYSGYMGDLFTLAHEIGHGIHFMISSESNSYINYTPLKVIAEGSSTFVELLLTEELLRQRPKCEQQEIISFALNNFLSNIFDQMIYTIMELHVHHSEGYITPQELVSKWKEILNEFYKGTVDFAEGQFYYFASITHYFCEPFICFTYIIGQLFSLAIYCLYEEDKSRGIDIFMKFLRQGSKGSLRELFESLGFDLYDRDFWRQGFKYLKKLLSKL